MFVWGGGGSFAPVTFFCKTSWKNSIVFSKALTFRNHHCKIYKQLVTNTSLLYIRNTISVLYIYMQKSCFEKRWKFLSSYINKKLMSAEDDIFDSYSTVSNTGQIQ